jgi:hypothetical protein
MDCFCQNNVTCEKKTTQHYLNDNVCMYIGMYVVHKMYVDSIEYQFVGRYIRFMYIPPYL